MSVYESESYPSYPKPDATAVIGSINQLLAGTTSHETSIVMEDAKVLVEKTVPVPEAIPTEDQLHVPHAIFTRIPVEKHKSTELKDDKTEAPYKRPLREKVAAAVLITALAGTSYAAIQDENSESQSPATVVVAAEVDNDPKDEIIATRNKLAAEEAEKQAEIKAATTEVKKEVESAANQEMGTLIEQLVSLQEKLATADSRVKDLRYQLKMQTGRTSGLTGELAEAEAALKQAEKNLIAAVARQKSKSAAELAAYKAWAARDKRAAQDMAYRKGVADCQRNPQCT